MEILGESVDKSLRAALAKSEKTSSEQEEEEWLISLWVDTVKKRDALVQLEEENRKAGFDLDIRWAQDQIIVMIPEVIQTSDNPPYFVNGSFFLPFFLSFFLSFFPQQPHLQYDSLQIALRDSRLDQGICRVDHSPKILSIPR